GLGRSRLAASLQRLDDLGVREAGPVGEAWRFTGRTEPGGLQAHDEAVAGPCALHRHWLAPVGR
ncbi:MAG: hypothetical protein OXJ64_20615, partial [Boseongicola sp.]|nr:hypothetical protein [Boseongicola sp.]